MKRSTMKLSVKFPHWLTFLLWVMMTCAVTFGQTSSSLPHASWDKLPRWHGFNLLEKFNVHSNKPFSEEDFQMIHELGFNFVRLPLDYRCWIVDGDWEKFDEKTLLEIDQAIEFGRKYDIHVCLNFHRAPGYTVAQPPEKTDLWTDPKTQDVCAKHWAMFARRYQGIPNEQLSFNLFNEPSNIGADIYLKTVKIMVDAIRQESPDRLIISDGLDWGGKPFVEAEQYHIALASRGYAPFELTHYKASWVQGADRFPLPTWPICVVNGLLPGSFKKEQQLPLVINGPFKTDTVLRFNLYQVSNKATIDIKADGKNIFENVFVCGDGDGEWSEVVYKPEWNCYQNIYDKIYSVVIPGGTEKVEIGVSEGDWVSLTRLEIQPQNGQTIAVNMMPNWSEKPAILFYLADTNQFAAVNVRGKKYLFDTMIRPWLEVEKHGIGIMIGEFGAHNQTPHDVTLSWLEDCLENWDEAGWGWAMWNFRGSIGVLNSGREDVEYENFHGHKLDRKMLDLLQRYNR